MMPFFGVSSWDLMLLLPAMALSLWAQFKVKSTYSKYSQIASRRGTSGARVAKDLLSMNAVNGVEVTMTEGFLGDHYDPTKKVVSLSTDNYNSASVAALAVAAHEVGHAIQHKVAYAPLNFRTSFFPVANIGSSLAFPLLLAGMFMSIPILVDVGIVFFSAAVIFQLVTLPVEFDASRRALVQLQNGGFLGSDEIGAAKKVLTAAALTYVAATAVAVAQLIRLLILRNASED
jgi:Zn-dependent membrane protease YugP